MRSLPIVAAGAVALATLTVVGATVPAAHAAPADFAYALSGTDLLTFDVADPTDVTSQAITGVAAGESLVAIDIRPQSGQPYALGINAVANTGTLYALHPRSGVAAVIGSASGAIAFTTDGATPVDFPDAATVGYDIDVNPTADRIRVVAGSLSFRVNPNTGGAVDGDGGGAGGSVAGLNPDGAINGATTSVNGAAYTNDRPNNGNITTLYTLDPVTNSLYIQNPANAGTQTLSHPVTMGGGSFDFSSVDGFDIARGVDAASNNAAVLSGSGYAVLSVGGSTKLYTIDLTSGVATLVGAVGSGLLDVQGLALQGDVDDGYPAIALAESGTSLTRFSTISPDTTTTQALNLASVAAGESLAAIAWRPMTGQLLGLGVNPTSDAGSLYLVDPQTGSVSPIGSSGMLAWVDGTATQVELPNPATTAYTLDVNPTTDRVRITAGSGLNARANPITGAAVDGDNGGSPGSSVGVNPDGAIGLALTGAAFTNSFGGATGTTLFGIAPTLDQLVTVTSPNAGTVGSPVPVTLGGSALDFSTFGGLEVPQDVPGTVYALLTVSGQSGLYTIDVSTGAATSIGNVGTGAVVQRSLALGQAGANRPVVTPPPPSPATLAKVGSAKQQKKVIDTGRSLACPTGFGSAACTTKIKVTVTYPVKGKKKTVVIATRTVKTNKGSATRLKVTLSKAGVKLLKQRTTLTAKVAITAPTGSAGANKTTTLTVKLAKKKL